MTRDYIQVLNTIIYLMIFVGTKAFADEPHHFINPIDFLANTQTKKIICSVLYKDKMHIYWDEGAVYANFTDAPADHIYYSDSGVPSAHLFSVFGVKLSRFDLNAFEKSEIHLYLLSNFTRGTLIKRGVYYELYDCHPLPE